MKKQKFLSLLLSLVMVLALLPMSVFAADAGSTGGTASGWTVSKSKTATVLDSNDQTTVTLSLPSAQETLTSDVVFVLDKSSCKAETATAGKNMLNALTAYLASGNADIKIAVVAFDGTSHVLYELTKFTGSDEQIKVINDYMAANSIPSADKVSGTNMQAGLAATQKLLAADSDVASSHKYVVLVSDGLTRLFSDSNGNVKNIYTERTSESGTGLVCYGEMSTWELLRTENGNGDYNIPYNNWDTYFAKVKSWITTDGDNYAMDFSIYGNDATGTGYNDRKTYPYFKYIENGTSDNHAMNVDRAVYEAYYQYKIMTDAGYKCYAVNTASYPFSAAFMGALNVLGGKTGTVDFTTIQNEICYTLASGTVTDPIGTNFDLVTNFNGSCPFTLTLGDKTLNPTKDSTDNNIWYFGTADPSTGKFPYSVTYTPGKDESFVWTINVPVENANRVQLSYTLKLVNKATTAGTYDVPTNGTTTLDYLSTGDSVGTTPHSENFTVPTVNYTVPAPIIIIPPTPTEDIPDPEVPKADLPSDLNSVDHFKYIVGYPDGTVQPNGNISRAEVTTAFYRLLTAEKRDAVFTAANTFTDVKSTQWFNKAVSSMANGSYVLGYPDGSFGGSRNITRAEFVAIASRFMNAKDGAVTFSDVSSGNWAYQYISTAVAYGWIDGYPDGTFRPSQPITRAEAMTIINRMLNRGVDADGVIDGIVAWPDNTAGAWYYYDVVEATNDHLYDGSRPSEKWSSLQTDYSYDIVKYEHP